MSEKSATVTVSLSTNPSVSGRYFIDLRDTTAGANRQITTRYADADGVAGFLAELRPLCRNAQIGVTVTDTSGELDNVCA